MKKCFKTTVIGITMLALALSLSACGDDSSKNTADTADVAIPVTDETVTDEPEEMSLDIAATKDENPQEETAKTTEDENKGNTETSKKADTGTAKAADNMENTSNALTSNPEVPQVTQAPSIQQAEPATNTQTTTSSSGASYEQIFNEYKQKLADYFGTAKSELQSEASGGKSIDALATSCSNKVSRLAEISTEGVNKMADLCVKRGGSASDYMNYATKLEGVYMDYGTKLESVYMSGAVGSQTKAVEDAMKDLGLSSDISGQYNEELNKAMDQYNDELNKAMDDYNQQMQDMLKQYGL